MARTQTAEQKKAAQAHADAQAREKATGTETEKSKGNGNKTVCPITRTAFSESAKPMRVTIGDKECTAEVKMFETGSLGWFVNEKVTIEVGGVQCKVNVGLNLILVGSKELPREEGAEKKAS